MSDVSADSTTLPEVSDNVVRFVCVSDTHNNPPLNTDVPDGDVLLHAGDFSNYGKPAEVEAFNSWLGSLQHKHKIVVAGNHEPTFNRTMMAEDPDSNVQKYLTNNRLSHMLDVLTNCVFLEDSVTAVYGIMIYGATWESCFCDAPYQSGCSAKWRKIPAGTDVLLTHLPPKGQGDSLNYSPVGVGCKQLKKAVQQRVKCRFHVFGHIHEAYGVSTDGITTYINAAMPHRAKHEPRHPIVFDFALPAGFTKSNYGPVDGDSKTLIDKTKFPSISESME